MLKNVATSPYRRDFPLWAIVGFAALLRLIYVIPRHVAFADEPYYVWLARSLYSAQGYSYYWEHPELHFPPLHPIVLGILHWFAPSWQSTPLIAYVLFGSLLPLPIYALGQRCYGRRIGLWAASLSAALPALTSGILFAESMSEPLYLLCLFTAIHFAYCAWRETRPRYHWLTGVFFSLAYLTRPEGLGYFLMAFLFLLLATLRRGKHRLFQRTMRLAPVLATFLAVASPYIVYLRWHTGHWSLTTKHTTTYTTTRGIARHDRVSYILETDGLNSTGEIKFFAKPSNESLLRLMLGPYRSQVLPEISANLKTFRNTVIHPWFFGRWLFVFVFLGLFAQTWSRKRLGTEVFHTWIALAVLSILPFFIKERLLYGLILPLTLWCAVGLDHSLVWIGSTALPAPLNRPAGRRTMMALLACAVFAMMLKTGLSRFLIRTREREHVWPTVAWVEKNLPKDAVLMTNSAEVPFHAERGWIPLPVADLPELLAYGRKRGATHLCLQGYFLLSRPEMKKDLYDNARDREELRLLAHEDNPKDGVGFAVYTILPPRS